MMTETMPAAEKKGLLRETLEKAGKAADVAVDARLLKKRLENAVEEAKFDAQRMARRGKYAMEEAFDDTAYRIRKEPWKSVGYVFGAGLGIGILAGLLFARRPKCEE